MALASLRKNSLVATKGESFVEWCYVLSFLGSLVGTKMHRIFKYKFEEVDSL